MAEIDKSALERDVRSEMAQVLGDIHWAATSHEQANSLSILVEPTRVRLILGIAS